MENQELQNQVLLHQLQEPSLLSQISEKTQSHNCRPPNLLTWMDNSDSLQGLPLSPTQESFKMFSLNATPSLKHIERGRSPKRQYTSRSNQSSLEHSAMIGEDQMQCLGCSLHSHDSEIEAAASKGKGINPLQHSSSPPILISDDPQSNGEPDTKRIKIDESAYAWVANRQFKCTDLQDSLGKMLRLIETYTIDLRTTKQSLVNEPDCPEFPDSEWKNIISGRAVNLDAVLSGQLSTTHDEPKVKKFGDLKITFGAIEPTKTVKNGGDWSITWNRTVRATLFTFPHQIQELSCYREYVINLFYITHPSMHSRVIAFDKAVRKRVGSVRNLKLSDFEKFTDLKIAHMDLIRVSVILGSSKDESG